jgi:hypothetical protein
VSDVKEDYATRTVAKRTPEAAAQIAAAKVMPGNADPEMTSDPEESDAADAAEMSVKGRPGMPGVLPGTTFGRAGKGS